MENLIIDVGDSELTLQEFPNNGIQIGAGSVIGYGDWGCVVLTVEQAIQARDWLTAWIESQS